MPSALTDSRNRGLTQSTFELVSEDDSYDQLRAARIGAFTTTDCRRDYVGWVRWILLPIDVVVIHATHHKRVRQGCGNYIHLFAGTDHGRRAAARGLVQDFECDRYIVLTESAERAT